LEKDRRSSLLLGLEELAKREAFVPTGKDEIPQKFGEAAGKPEA